MTREEVVNSMSLQDAIQVLKDTNCYGTMDIAKTVLLKALEQEPCTDAISREDALMALTGEYTDSPIEILPKAIKRINALPPVTPQPKMGHWVLTQRDKYIDINCSKCGNTRIKEYAYNYTVDEIDMQEIKDLVVTNKMNYCECCGAKMQEVKE